MERSLETLLEDQTLPTHRAVAAHWLDLYTAAGNHVPRLRDIDPLHLRQALPDIWIIDAEPGHRFRFHLAGQNMVDWYGGTPKGLYFEEIYPPEVLTFVTATARQIVERPAICFQKAASLTKNWSLPIPMERLGLPLTNDQGQVRHLFGVTTIFDRQGHGGGLEASSAELEAWYPVHAGNAANS